MAPTKGEQEVLKSTLLATKLHRPSPPANRVQRPFLTKRLHDGLARNRQITLVSAPAGFGKTTCVSEWINALQCPAAWLSLDAADDDPGRFFAYLLAALQKIDARFGREIVGVLHAGQLPPGEIIAATLINDILVHEEQFLLVLDDFHVIQDRFILAVCEQLLANLPPPLHLVLVTREDPPLPLARLRANNLLTEIRAHDLRFSGDDAARFLASLGLSLTKTDVAALEAKTEGWIAGLQLAALALQSSPSAAGSTAASEFIAALSGSHRFILDYLTEQVLDRQPQAVQDFLLQTAVLDKLHGDLCNAVTGRTDGRSLLNQLYNANLFLVPLDDEGEWYRYHHLFADLLRDRQRALRGAETAVLHQRAGQWYAQAGMVSEAMRHALAAADYAQAVTLLERHAMRLIMQGYVKTVNGWVQAIPARWRRQSPKTNLAFAWMHLLRGAYAQAAPYLERVEQSFSAAQESTAEQQTLRAEWLVMQSLLLNMEGKPAQSLALANEALALSPQGNGRLRSLAYFGLACAHQAAEDETRAVDAYQTAVQYAQSADNLVAEMLSTSGLSVMAFERGRLHLAHEIAAPVCERLQTSGTTPPISAVIYGVLAEVYYQWAQTEQARQHAQRALQLSTLGGYKSGMIGCRVLLSRLALLAGDLENAAQEIRQAVEQLQAETPDYVHQEAVAQQVRVSLARGRVHAARLALQGQGFSCGDVPAFPALSAAGKMTHAFGLLANSALHFLLFQARTAGDLAAAKQGIAVADELVAQAEQARYRVVALEALLLRAQLHTLLGNHHAARTDYVGALKLAQPEGFVGVFVEQGTAVATALAKLRQQNQPDATLPETIAHILAAFNRLQSIDAARAASPLIEPLSERELEVLRLMAEGLKYREIADRLVISLNTVRYHVKALYGKLNVNNRTQAIATARQQKIL